MLELIHTGVPNIVCTQPFGCLPNHVVGKGVIKELRRRYPASNVVAIDYDPGASEVNQLNRLKLMLSTANKHLNEKIRAEKEAGNNDRTNSNSDAGHGGHGPGAGGTDADSQTGASSENGSADKGSRSGSPSGNGIAAAESF